jgi:hypothetical protein
MQEEIEGHKDLSTGSWGAWLQVNRSTTQMAFSHKLVPALKLFMVSYIPVLGRLVSGGAGTMEPV